MQVQIIATQVTVGYISRVLAGFQAYSHIATDIKLISLNIINSCVSTHEFPISISLKATVSLYKIKLIVLPEGQIED